MTALTTLAETALLNSKDGPVKKFHIMKQFGALLRTTMPNVELQKLGSADLAAMVTRMLEAGR